MDNNGNDGRPSVIYETLSRFTSSDRPGDLVNEPRKTRACSVQVLSNTTSPFAMRGLTRRETTHIIYPEWSSSAESVDVIPTTPVSPEAQTTTPLTRLAESIRLNFGKNRSPQTGREFHRKCKAFIVDRVINRRRGDSWIASLDGIDIDVEEVESDGDWAVLEKVDDDFAIVELRPIDLEPRGGFSLDIPFEDVKKGRKIGEGAFGLVYRATYQNRLVVLKEVAPHHYHTGHGRRFIESLKSELCVLGALGTHPNVLECYGGSLKAPNVFMLCQLMDMTLADLIYGQPDGPAPLPVELALHIAHDILAGLHHLHKMCPQVVHRDLKPENILLNERKHACVADFGLSRTKSHTYIQTENTHAGTPEYLAPEAATGKMNEKMDIYGLGVILWECLMAQRPWEGYHPFAIFLNVAEGQRLPLPDNVFPTLEEGISIACFSHDVTVRPCQGDPVMFQVRKIIERCWVGVPDRRPGALEVMDDIEDIFLDMYQSNQHQNSVQT